jgi:hypothetical protein
MFAFGGANHAKTVQKAKASGHASFGGGRGWLLRGLSAASRRFAASAASRRFAAPVRH